MREIPVSKFKATCLAVVEDVRKTRRPFRITRFGKPVAEIVPIPQPAKRVLGLGKDLGEVIGDIVGPIRAFDNWKMRMPRARKRS